MLIPSDQTMQQDATLQELLDLYARIQIEIDAQPPDTFDEPLMTRGLELVMAGITHLQRTYGLSMSKANQRYSRARTAARRKRNLPEFLDRVTLGIAMTHPVSYKKRS